MYFCLFHFCIDRSSFNFVILLSFYCFLKNEGDQACIWRAFETTYYTACQVTSKLWLINIEASLWEDRKLRLSIQVSILHKPLKK